MKGTGSGDTGTSTQRLHSPFGQPSLVHKSYNHLDIPGFVASQMGVPMPQLSPNLCPENSKRPGIPPSYPSNPFSVPNSQSMPRSASRQPSSQNLSPVPSHSRSLSQPPFFSLDCLPPLSPSPYREPAASSLSDPVSTDVSMEDSAVNSHLLSLPSPVTSSSTLRVGESLPPRRGHRRSNSDIPLGFSAMIQSSPQLIPIGSQGTLGRSLSGRENSGSDKPVLLMKKGSTTDRDGNVNLEGMSERKSEADISDDLFSAYMNMENIDMMNSSGTEDKDLDSKASGSKTNGGESSDNEVESCINANLSGFHGSVSRSTINEREGLKRSASGDSAPPTRHYRSVSMDSYMGSLDFDSESPNLPPLGTRVGQHSPSSSFDGNSNRFSMEFGNGDFSENELKKIMENDKLAEIALSDPKRAKRILANRQSAARSKERKMRYIAELEHKVQTLQTEATTLSAQLTKLQRESVGLSSDNSELKFRVQAMEQQGQLKDALNEALTAEVQRLKLVAAELGGEAHLSSCMAQQLSINQQIFHHHNFYQLQQQNGEAAKPDSKPKQ